MNSVRRKVQRTGTSTLAVSLPKAWAKKYGIRQGAELFIRENGDGMLSLSPTDLSAASQPKTDLCVDDYKDIDSLRRKFLAAYLNGFTIIRLHSKGKFPSNMRRAIIEEAHKLIGVEATEETPTTLVVQDFFSHEGLSVEKTLRRAHLLASGMCEDLLGALSSGDRRAAAVVIARDDEVDRLRFLLLRQLNLALNDSALLAALNLNTRQCVNYATVVIDLERVADKITKIAKYYAELPSKESEATKELFKKLLELNRKVYALYSNAVKAFLGRDAALANAVIREKDGLFFARVEFDKGFAAHKAPYQYSVMLDSLMEIAEHCAEISEIAIDES
ncbi:phosphate uptake regulator PhoU [Candidatus Micrarchaeota archaeon]|nr:phosphate uptake regulator PhoU [Candidatus Micrarchaeota archaeon]MBI5177056.1 phosphate uptake regulator PhoU [Candidatus Micrarchaeota archaeon]